MWALAKYIIDNGGVKLVQRGTTSAAGNVTITPVNMDKAFVLSVSKGSAGTVAATGTVASHSISGSTSGSLSGSVTINQYSNGYTLRELNDNITKYSYPSYLSGTRSLSGTSAAASISGGTTNLTVKEYSARLTASNTLYCDGPVEWQVVEYQ